MRYRRLGEVGGPSETRREYIHVGSSPTSMPVKVSEGPPTPLNLAVRVFQNHAILIDVYVHLCLSNAIIMGSDIQQFCAGASAAATTETNPYKADIKYGFSQNPRH